MHWIKWILMFVGFKVGGFLGGLIGLGLGYFIEHMLAAREDNGTQQQGYNRSERAAYSRQTINQRLREAFIEAFLQLSADIIAADGKIMHSEMELMRNFLRQAFDPTTAENANQRLLQIFQEKKSMTAQAWKHRVSQACRQIAMLQTEESRLQLLMFLAEIAKADGNVDATEVSALKHIAMDLGFSPSVIDQMLAAGKESLDDAYKTLGLTPEATDEEVKRAYKKMALKYHPDRVATLGADIQEEAKRQFQKINDAKDRIYKARGL